MRLRDLLGSKNEPTPPALAIHPPWMVGQYVTYVLERDDRSWTALAIQIVARTDDGKWILTGDVKTVAGECRQWMRSDPDAPADTPDPVPGRVDILRRSPGYVEETEDFERVFALPEMQTALPFNLLFPRCSPAAREALRGPAQWRRYPCGIDRVHTFVSPAPGYQKHHYLNPRVMITGIACLATDGDGNPTTATSFGLRAPNSPAQPPYDDWIDYSHRQAVHHEDFWLTYPATWFLQPQPQNDGSSRTLATTQGGNSNAFSLFVTIERGTAEVLSRSRVEKIQRLNDQSITPQGALIPDTMAVPPSLRHGDAFRQSFRNPEIDGLHWVGLFGRGEDGHLAAVSAFGCVSKASPRRHEALDEMDDAARLILESFRWVDDE
jgi:hypothetical protein